MTAGVISTVAFAVIVEGLTEGRPAVEAFDLVMSVAAGQPDAEEICKRLRLAKAPS